jgi:hypothetical protein
VPPFLFGVTCPLHVGVLYKQQEFRSTALADETPRGLKIVQALMS